MTISNLGNSITRCFTANLQGMFGHPSFIRSILVHWPLLKLRYRRALEAPAALTVQQVLSTLLQFLRRKYGIQYLDRFLWPVKGADRSSCRSIYIIVLICSVLRISSQDNIDTLVTDLYYFRSTTTTQSSTSSDVTTTTDETPSSQTELSSTDTQPSTTSSVTTETSSMLPSSTEQTSSSVHTTTEGRLLTLSLIRKRSTCF